MISEENLNDDILDEVDQGNYNNEKDDDNSELSHSKEYNPKEILEEITSENNLKYTSKSYSIEWLIEQLGKGKYKIPGYQRRYVWSAEQVTALVVSLLKRMPIPKLYGYYTESEEINATLVIDGQQRLTSLFMYYWGIFPKSKNRIDYASCLQEIAELCKDYYSNKSSAGAKQTIKETLATKYQLRIDYKFVYSANEYDEKQHKLDLSYRGNSDLNEQQKFRLLDRELDFLIVEGNNFSEAVDLFRIYNSAGTPLNTQEIRNGLYQKNCLYKLINEYSDNILSKDGINYDSSHNWSRFNKKGIVGDRMEIKRLFQLLAYYFSFSHSIEKAESQSYKFEKRDSPLLIFLKNRTKEELTSIELDIYSKHYRKKGSLEKMINNYSEYIAENGDNKELLTEEFQTIEDFFKLNFENRKPENTSKFNYNNLCMIYLILRSNNKLKTYMTIPEEAVYYDSKGLSLNNPEGYLRRITEIRNILIRKGVI